MYGNLLMNNMNEECERSQMFEMYVDIDWGLKNKKKLEQINRITLFLMKNEWNEEWVYCVKWICRYLMRINEEGDEI